MLCTGKGSQIKRPPCWIPGNSDKGLGLYISLCKQGQLPFIHKLIFSLYVNLYSVKCGRNSTGMTGKEGERSIIFKIKWTVSNRLEFF